MLILFLLMAIFGWGWTLFGIPMGWIGIVGVVLYLAAFQDWGEWRRP